MIDPRVSLAFAIHANRGTYALLLGSGVSRSAEIATGWEIVLDLIRKLAQLHNEDPGQRPDEWYARRFNRQPDYSELLEALARTPADRSLLLRNYFEPSAEDRERGAKMPRPAHHAIARLVADGYLRLIVTTNFDPLIERACEAIGATLTIVSTSDQIEGALPLVHAGPLLVKVNGDYRDVRIRNTPAELETYDERTTKFLDRIFDEFGLVVCGWSGEWDIALRSAIERCPSRRFTMFWAARGDIGDVARRLVERRAGQVVGIADADSFLSDLAQNVAALARVERSHPLSIQVAVERLKRDLGDPTRRIAVHDLVMEQVEHVFAQLGSGDLSLGEGWSDHEFRRRVERYEAMTEPLLPLVVTGCRWGEKGHEETWVAAIERLGTPLQAGGVEVYLRLRSYPALQVLYAAGIAAFVSGRYEVLTALLTEPTHASAAEQEPLLLRLHPDAVMRADVANLLHRQKLYTPVSDRLFTALRNPLRPYLPDDIRYERAFDRFEYLMALVHADLGEKRGFGGGWAGRFSWKDWGEIRAIMGEFDKEIVQEGASSKFLNAGLFDGSPERARGVKERFDAKITAVKQRGW
jgi:hypothetical protein